MHNRLILSAIILIAACGDNTHPPVDSGPDIGPNGPTDDPPIGPGSDCVAIDWNQTCPMEPDAGTETPPPELDDDQKAACCHALLDGTPPNHECGYPPGLCKNGKKDMFCKNADGTDAKFTLCNP